MMKRFAFLAALLLAAPALAQAPQGTWQIDAYPVDAAGHPAASTTKVPFSSVPIAAGQLPAGQFPGTTTNDAASTGNVGEYVSAGVASGSAIPLTNATTANLASISLTPGDWDVWCNGIYLIGTGASTTLFQTTVSLNSGVAGVNAEGLAQQNLAAGTTLGAVNQTASTGPRRISIAVTTTVYGTVTSNFSGGTVSAWGTLRARRVR